MFSKRIDSQLAIIPFIIFGILFGVIIGLGLHIGMCGIAGGDKTLESAMGISVGFGGSLLMCMLMVMCFGSLLVEPFRSNQV